MSLFLSLKDVVGMAIVLALLAIFDAVATWYVVSSGYAVEANPLLAVFIDRFGLVATLVTRTVLVLLGLGVVVAIKSAYSLLWVDQAIRLMAATYCYVAAWHTYGYIVYV